eukprot:6473308-Amphidinium_carterae.3
MVKTIQQSGHTIQKAIPNAFSRNLSHEESVPETLFQAGAHITILHLATAHCTSLGQVKQKGQGFM